MENIRNYILALTAAAILCGIVTSLMGGKGTSAALTKLICGIFMAMVVVSPLVSLEFDDWTAWTSQLSFDAGAAAAQGEAVAGEMYMSFIKEQSESYILDKAEALGASVTVEVTVEDGLPAEVWLAGDISPYAKGKLTAYISEELGIPKEKQQWNGNR